MERLLQLIAAALALSTLPGCVGGEKSGQSGSEFTPGDDHDQGDSWSNNSRDELCPCEYLQGVAPLRGTVISWYAGLLEVEVDEVLLDPAPSDAPAIGARVIGMFDGALPCHRGLYLPEVGDSVLAFMVPDPFAKPWCCETAACGPQCEGGGPESVDSCLAECQRPAAERCIAEFEDVEITGQLEVTPFDPERLQLATAGDASLSIDRSDLGLLHEGGGACSAALGEVRENLKDDVDPPGTRMAPQWRASCPGLSEPDP